MISIVDYGMCNVGSISNMLKKIGVSHNIISTAAELQLADKIILPGVGAFDNGMRELANMGLTNTLNAKALKEKVPVLGICLGMQLLGNNSEEGCLPGLGWIKATARKFDFSGLDRSLKIPHMGWNNIQIKRNSPILNNMYSEPRFYFVHSYHVDCENKEEVIATTRHGFEVAAIIGRDNIFGAQFHPEKSHKFGMKLLENFSKI